MHTCVWEVRGSTGWVDFRLNLMSNVYNIEKLWTGFGKLKKDLSSRCNLHKIIPASKSQEAKRACNKLSLCNGSTHSK